MNTLEIVLKLTERCNIDCSYCYVFNKGDDSYMTNPPKISKKTIVALKDFIQDAVENNNVTLVQIDLHGGEPLLLGKDKFQEYLDILQSVVLPGEARIKFALQTNGTLITEDWIEIIANYNISVGVSLDGPKHLNDKNRIDFKGKGTYDRTVAGFKLLKKALDQGKIEHIGILSVSNPEVNSTEIYNHFVNELGIESFDILFPTESHDDFNHETANGYANHYLNLFNAWKIDPNERVQIRTIKNIYIQLMDGKNYIDESLEARKGKHLILTVSSSGAIGPDDSLRTLQGKHFKELDVLKSSYSDVLNSVMFKKILRAENTIPDDCKECCWKQLCRGGATGGRLVNRYKSGTGFNNKSVMCETLDELYTEISAHLLKSKITFDELQESLFSNKLKWNEYTEAQVYEEANL